MGSPGITEPPDGISMAVEDPDLAIHGACGASVTVAVERDSLDQVLVAVLHDEIKVGSLLHDGRLSKRRRHLLFCTTEPRRDCVRKCCGWKWAYWRRRGISPYLPVQAMSWSHNMTWSVHLPVASTTSIYPGTYLHLAGTVGTYQRGPGHQPVSRTRYEYFSRGAHRYVKVWRTSCTASISGRYREKSTGDLLHSSCLTISYFPDPSMVSACNHGLLLLVKVIQAQARQENWGHMPAPHVFSLLSETCQLVLKLPDLTCQTGGRPTQVFFYFIFRTSVRTGCPCPGVWGARG